jgi:hypothetical protein
MLLEDHNGARQKPGTLPLRFGQKEERNLVARKSDRKR